MVNHGVYEGWKIHAETNNLKEAIKLREDALSMSSQVVIFKPVRLRIKERVK